MAHSNNVSGMSRTQKWLIYGTEIDVVSKPFFQKEGSILARAELLWKHETYTRGLQST
jgi:hypothetical protein